MTFATTTRICSARRRASSEALSDVHATTAAAAVVPTVRADQVERPLVHHPPTQAALRRGPASSLRPSSSVTLAAEAGRYILVDHEFADASKGAVGQIVAMHHPDTSQPRKTFEQYYSVARLDELLATLQTIDRDPAARARVLALETAFRVKISTSPRALPLRP